MEWGKRGKKGERERGKEGEESDILIVPTRPVVLPTVGFHEFLLVPYNKCPLVNMGLFLL